MKKASKRLVSAIIALVASVLLCIGVCLAWFAVNNDVRGDGLQTEIKSNEVVSFDVIAYFLDYSSADKTYSIVNGNKDIIKDASGNKITVDYNNNTKIDSDGGNKDVMRPFSLSGEYTTAVLFKIDYEILGSSENNFRIFAQCPTDTRLIVEEVEGETDKFTSNLSNAVKFVQASKSDDAYSASTGKQTFINELYEKSFHISLYDGITANSPSGTNYRDTKYVIMDYDKDRFTYISSLLLESGGGLNSGLTLLGDITLGIEEYTNDTVVPTSIEVDTHESNKSTAYTQPTGADVISPKWQFVVTYSDGTKKVVCGQNKNLKIDIDTLTVGKRTATATYTEEYGKPQTCSVPYTIGLVIAGGTGVAKNDKLELSATGLSGDITWTVDKPEIALFDDGSTGSQTISLDGGSPVTLKGVSEGTVTITATATGYKKDDASTHYLMATCELTVTAAKVPVTGVSLDKSTLSLEIGNTATLQATIEPEKATNKAVTWSSNNESVATVSNGEVRAISAGTAIITVTTKDGSHTATCTVTVPKAAVAVERVTISGDKTVAVKSTITLTATVLPSNATNNTVTWEVIDGETGSATITQGGVLTGVTPGTVTVIATAGGVSGEYEVNVTGIPVTAITLSKATSTLTVGSNEKLTPTITPSNATIPYVSWSSSDTSIATVDGNGNVTAKKEGEAIITATAKDGSGVSASCKYTITKVSVTKVTINSSSPTTVDVGSSITLTATVEPDTATYKTVTWEVSDTTIATIASKGENTCELKGVKAGTVTVTATADGKTSTAHTVLVKEVTYVADVAYAMDEGKIDSAFTISNGTYSSTSITYNGSTCARPLKMESSTSISFKLKAEKTVKLVTDTASKRIKIDGKSYTTDSNGTYSIKLAAGTHTITKGDSINLGFIIVGEEATPTVESVTVSGATTVANGGTLQLTATVKGTNNPAQTVTWSIKSGATATGATVNNGLLSAGTVAGKVTVVATSTVDTSKSGEITITVQAATPTVESVTVTAADGATTVANGGTLQLTATVKGTNNPAQTVTWSIKSGATATGASVSNSGLLSAGTVAGKVTVIATSTVDTSKKGEITITVQAAISEVTSQTNSMAALGSGATISKGVETVGELFNFKTGAGGTVTKNYSTATADDGTGKTFDYGLLPSGGSNNSLTITAKKDISLTLYYVATDGGFSTKDQSKSGNLTWTITSSDGTTSKGSSTKTGSKDNTIAYSEVITLSAGDVCVITINTNRFVIYEIDAITITSST